MKKLKMMKRDYIIPYIKTQYLTPSSVLCTSNQEPESELTIGGPDDAGGSRVRRRIF
jgi:hypothetical protein